MTRTLPRARQLGSQAMLVELSVVEQRYQAVLAVIRERRDCRMDPQTPRSLTNGGVR
jgi:hypothetical protein